mmetsp:Transcript_44195/g.73686  ORF Transcript_44195/g.73686 Transcript_44195/m.73686 type:complete len:202 (-) Transcript_44195:202-807(-)
MERALVGAGGSELVDLKVEGGGLVSVDADVVLSDLGLTDGDGKVSAEGGVAVIKIPEVGLLSERDVHVAVAARRLVDDKLRGEHTVDGRISLGVKLEPNPVLLGDRGRVDLVDGGDDGGLRAVISLVRRGADALSSRAGSVAVAVSRARLAALDDKGELELARVEAVDTGVVKASVGSLKFNVKVSVAADVVLVVGDARGV